GSLEAQDVIDAIDVHGGDAVDVRRRLLEADAGHATFESALEGWVVDQLRFDRNAGNVSSTQRRYEPRVEVQPASRGDFYEYFTCGPVGWVMAHLAGDSEPIQGDGRYHRRVVGALMRRYRSARPVGVFDREQAVGRSDVELFRLGSPFIDAMH